MLEKLDQLNNFEIPEDMQNMDINDLVDKSQKGIDMVKDMHNKIEGLNNPMINEGLKTIKDNEMVK